MSEIYGDYKTYWGINDLTDKTNWLVSLILGG